MDIGEPRLGTHTWYSGLGEDSREKFSSPGQVDHPQLENPVGSAYLYFWQSTLTRRIEPRRPGSNRAGEQGPLANALR